MTSKSYFGKMNSTLGSVVPLAIFHFDSTWSYFIRQSELNGSDDVDGHNDLVISELGF